MSRKEKFYLTTAIAYTSRKPHIGNTYEIVLADAIARFKRMEGYDVYFLTGTDEHGQKIEEYAKSSGKSPKEYVDEVSGEVKRIWNIMGSSHDKFIRTTDADHEKAVAKIFRRLYEQGDIYKSEYEGNYCVPCESFFTETQLVDGCCPDCGRAVKKTKEEAYFFRMSKYQDRLMEHIEKNPDFIVPESRKREMVNNFLKPGLQDLCVSRTSFKWGIPVDFDDKHVIYVWIDALSNYITALGYEPDKKTELYNKNWPADVHIIGKDILRFHTIYWPIILMALGEELPKQIFGHPWLLSGSDKMSKSKGNVMYADDLAELFSVDAVRYYLLSEMPYGSDGNISFENMIVKFNADLANTIGNLVSRTAAMTEKYFGGTVLTAKAETELDRDLIEVAEKALSDYKKAMDEYKTADAIEAILTLARRSNKYIDETMPWALAKDENKKEELSKVLRLLLVSIEAIGNMLLPIMPESAEKIIKICGGKEKELSEIDLSTLSSVTVCPGEVLFARLDEAKKMAEIEEFYKKDEPKEREDLITIDEFAKTKLVAAKVESAEKLEGSDKLLRLMLNDGKGVRQVVSGIAKNYTPEELVGKTVVLVENLKPAKLRGAESCGMILAADVKGGCKVLFLDGVEAGAEIH
ncbi:MAG: methionine--tRNA ligase [Oscillospiraceae bacterium]|nr:methionine--tRNA ligase [Oscillospiraceae bacterium]